VSAYRIHLTRRKCYCGREADYRVYNSRKAPCGWYCDRHSREKLRELDKFRAKEDAVV